MSHGLGVYPSPFKHQINALVSDQVSRLRRLLGDRNNMFAKIFRETCGKTSRRPQFGMYTGRTPYLRDKPNKQGDNDLVRTLSEKIFSANDSQRAYIDRLTAEGRVPAKIDMAGFIAKLHKGIHVPDDETKNWLRSDENNKLLFVIDEAHMYRGSAGGEVALLIRRFLHRLGITRERVQFILTTASMPGESQNDNDNVMSFARDLTSAERTGNFCYFTGEDENTALYCVGVLLSVAPLAKSKDGAVLFPARMHMLFRGITGVYSCMNENCSHSHFFSKARLTSFSTRGNQSFFSLIKSQFQLKPSV